jgi:hypothetical protein
VTLFASPIWSQLEVVIFVDHFRYESQAIVCFAKQQKALSVTGVIGDGMIATMHDHIGKLALAKIFKHPVRSRSVRVSVNEAFFACNDDDQGVLGWCDDSPLLLTSVLRVNVLSSMIDFSFFKTPTHLTPRVKGAAMLTREYFGSHRAIAVTQCC